MPAAAATPAEFYLGMLQKGIAAFDAGRFDTAVGPLRIAAFGLVDSVEHYETAQIHLALCHDKLANEDAARDAAKRVVMAERVQARYGSLAIPAAKRTAFDSVARKVLAPADLSVLNGTAPVPATPPRTSTTTPPASIQPTPPATNPATTAPRPNPPAATTPSTVSTTIPASTNPASTPPRTTNPATTAPATTASTTSPSTTAPATTSTTAPATTSPAPTPPRTTTTTTTTSPSTTPPHPTTTQPPAATTSPTSRPEAHTTPPASPSRPVDVPSRLAAAERALTAANLIEARAIYRELLDAPSLQRADALRVAEGSYRARDFAHALRAFERVGALRRGEEPYRYYIAVALYETGQYARAKEELAAVLPFIEETPDVTRYRVKIEGALH